MSNLSLVEAAGEALGKFGQARVGRRTVLAGGVAVPGLLGRSPQALAVPDRTVFDIANLREIIEAKGGAVRHSWQLRQGEILIVDTDQVVNVTDGNSYSIDRRGHPDLAMVLAFLATEPDTTLDLLFPQGAFAGVNRKLTDQVRLDAGFNESSVADLNLAARQAAESRFNLGVRVVRIITQVAQKTRPPFVAVYDAYLNPNWMEVLPPTAGAEAAAECPVNWEMPGIFRTTGVPSVGVTNIDFARLERGFNWGNLHPGMRAFFAEPGGLLADRNKIPADKLAEWDKIVRDSNGAVNFINPQNQQSFQRSEFAGAVPWKGYALFSLAGGRLTVPDEDGCLSATFLPRDGNNYLVAVKGRNGDQALDRTVQMDQVVAGHALYQRFDRAAYISAGQLNQLAEEAFKRAAKVTAVGFDLNTRAMMVVELDRGTSNWRWVNANYTGI